MLIDKYATDITPAQAKVCYSMSYKSGGLMIGWLKWARQVNGNDRVVIYERGGTIIGWGMRTELGHVGIWVRRGYRRQGVGTKILTRLKSHGPIKTLPHDATSELFFHKNDALKYKGLRIAKA